MGAKKKTPAEELKFEEAMAALEEIVRQLETGDIPLEDSLAAFERGVGLVRLLHQRLDAVQAKIEELTHDDRGNVTTRPLDEE